MIVSTVYGAGGLDTTKPNNNIIETTERINADECVVKEYDGETVVRETTVNIPEPPQTPVLLSVPSDAVDELISAMDDSSVNSVADIKQSIMQFASKIMSSTDAGVSNN